MRMAGYDNEPRPDGTETKPECGCEPSKRNSDICSGAGRFHRQAARDNDKIGSLALATAMNPQTGHSMVASHCRLSSKLTDTEAGAAVLQEQGSMLDGMTISRLGMLLGQPSRGP